MGRLFRRSGTQLAMFFCVFTLSTFVAAVNTNNDLSVGQGVEHKSYVLAVNDAVLASQLVISLGGTVSEKVLLHGEILVELSDAQAALISRSPTVISISERRTTSTSSIEQVAGNFHWRY